MFLSRNKSYGMRSVHSENVATEFTLKRSSRSLVLVSCIAVSTAAIWKCTDLSENFTLQNYVAVLAALISSLLLVLTLKRVHTESLLTVASMGVTIKRTSFLGTTSHYFDISQIEDIVIVEAITMHRVVFQLVLLPREKSGTAVKYPAGKIFPLFLDFRPKLEDLRQIYREVQEKLFPENLDVR